MTDVPGAGATPETPARDARTLIHFGWACAEVRGRHRQILTGHPEAPPDEPKERHEYTLPLNHERSAAELAIQAEEELAGLATQLGLDFAVARLPHPPSSFIGTVVEQLRALCKDASTEGDKARHDAWMKIANVFHEWDTVLQDTMASASATEAAAYQLGRGLAEAYWSLDPDIEDGDARSWPSLLGGARCEALQRFTVQLTPTYGTMTGAAVHASLEIWKEISEAPVRRRNPDALSALREQVGNWHMLVVEGVPPESFVTVHRLLMSRGSTWRIVQAFGASALFAILGLLAAIAAVIVLTLYKGSGVVSAALTVLALFGITGAALVAKAKDAANASLARMREAADRTLVAEAVTALPDEEPRWQLRSPIVRVFQTPKTIPARDSSGTEPTET